MAEGLYSIGQRAALIGGLFHGTVIILLIGSGGHGQSFRSYHTLFFGKTQAAPLTTAEESIIIKLMTLVYGGGTLMAKGLSAESITVAAAELIEQYGRSGFSMRLLADTVADRITPAVTSALGSDYNAY